ncbi:hypothetical protein [Desulfosporosinus sp. FKB]|uniref:hypothetical protein n=1 Tax=Desulfosporosinus sp. FKB TaxID=1969835 RepID=UPI000B49A11E|nr:hypothetical protein [Desulfosporosinus sp. FKB]
MDLSTTIPIVVAAEAISALIFGYLGYARGVKKESTLDGQEKGSIKSDIKYIMRRTDDLLMEQKETNKNFHTLSERLARVEEGTKLAHKRIDYLEKGERRDVRSPCD